MLETLKKHPNINSNDSNFTKIQSIKEKNDRKISEIFLYLSYFQVYNEIIHMKFLVFLNKNELKKIFLGFFWGNRWIYSKRYIYRGKRKIPAKYIKGKQSCKI